MTQFGDPCIGLSASYAPLTAVEVRKAVLFLRSLGRRSPASYARRDLHGSTKLGVFGPKDVRVLSEAFEGACAFFDKNCKAGPALRRRLACIIVHHAKLGLRDPHRLALKAIVS